MKYIKTFNEELSPDIYKNAGAVMKYRFKQNKRGDVLLNYAKERNLEEHIKNGVYECVITNYTWSSKESIDLMTGNFFIKMSVDTDWFNEMFIDHYYDTDCDIATSMPIEFGLIPADEETQKEFDIVSKKFTNEISSSEGVTPRTRSYWLNRLWLNFTTTSKSSYESMDYEKFYFTTRKDAVRFKKLIIDAFLDKNYFGRYGRKISYEIKRSFISLNTHIANEGNPIPFDNIDETYDKIISSIKSLSLNNFYRD